MSSLPERLRRLYGVYGWGGEAADRIEELERENVRLRKVLRKIAKASYEEWACDVARAALARPVPTEGD